MKYLENKTPPPKHPVYDEHHKPKFKLSVDIANVKDYFSVAVMKGNNICFTDKGDNIQELEQKIYNKIWKH